jgi:hypothetical protein
MTLTFAPETCQQNVNKTKTSGPWKGRSVTAGEGGKADHGTA